MSLLYLSPHPDSPAGTVRSFHVVPDRQDGWLTINYVVECSTDSLVLPAPAKPYRADDLWKTTCFELFIRGEGGRYREYNFSPSSQWAAYSFDGYRTGMTPLPMEEPPIITVMDADDALVVSVRVCWSKAELQIGVSAILEAKDGSKSYWAIAHPPGKPDFHDPACFALQLPAANAS